MKDFEPVELYDLTSDPHETENLARDRPDHVRYGLSLLDQWHSNRLLDRARSTLSTAGGGAASVADPLVEVVQEGGPFHARDDHFELYVDRLRATEREEHAEKLEAHRGLVPQCIEAYLEGSDVWAQ